MSRAEDRAEQDPHPFPANLLNYGIRSTPMKADFTVSIWQEEDLFIAQCLDVDVASQGRTEEKALANLREALELHFEEPVAYRP